MGGLAMTATHPTPTSTYTIPDLADMFQVHPRTVRRLVDSGRLGHARVGRQVRFTQRHVDAYLASVEVGPFEYGSML